MLETLLTEERKKLLDEVREFTKSIPRQFLLDLDADKIRYPKDYVRDLGKRNLLGLRFPSKYGGRGLGWVEEVMTIEEIGALGTTPGCLYSLPSIVGEALNVFGTEEQKEKYLKPTLRGELFTAEALTEPRGGSDFFGATTVAERKGDYYILNGQKRFVVGAEGADYFLVYAKTNPSAPPHKSISAFIVERDETVEVKHIYNLLGTRGGGTGRLLFKNTKVPVENLVGGENNGAEVFYQMMIPERMTSAAGALGISRIIELAARYTDKRKAFGEKIRKFQAVSFKIAESVTKIDAARALVYYVAEVIDRGNEDPGKVRRLVSEAKKFATEVAWEVVNNAMQVMGGIAYTSVYPVERALRDTRLIMIWTGTNEIMNLIIQHEYYKEILSSPPRYRDIEGDAPDADKVEEKVYE
uniref:Acyl-CoA dehydrogenase domain protein n=1 Tax=uncultured prokaryote TaxID=198431 RepID=H5SPX8_9ZZZZ|nr:acyl-CoA dehydrogenase domain protein [uncultured prokaryote]